MPAMTVPESPAPAEPEITELDEAFGSNGWLVDQMQALYESAPMSVSSAWRKFFAAGGVDAYRKPQLEGSAANGIPQPPEHEFDEDLA